MSSKMVELVFVPTPSTGHLRSAVHVAKLIVQRYQHISISIHIINLFAFTKINDYVDSQTRDNPYPTRLTFVTLPLLSNLPDPSSPSSFAAIIELHKPLVKQVVEDRVKDGFPKPAGFVLDMFCTTMADTANELEVPCYVFFTSGATLLNFIFFADSLADELGLEARDLALKFSDPELSWAVPGFKNPLTSKHIPAIFQQEFECRMLLGFAKRFRTVKGILVNSYIELESYPFQVLHDSVDKNVPPVYPVGPILDLNVGGGSEDSEKESIMQWLDGQPESSVVFLCFGSMGSFNGDQVKEIAHGLDRSGHRFLWALRQPPPEGKIIIPGVTVYLETLPEGFLDRTADRGKIIGWAPQVEVLAHPAIGGFVSHCGWNSTLESLWFGVPIGTWPLSAEQQLNAFELVKELELAVEIRMDYKMDRMLGKGNVLVTKTEIQEGVTKLIGMDDKMRASVKGISSKGKKTLEEGGSSYHSLGCFILDVLNNIS